MEGASLWVEKELGNIEECIDNYYRRTNDLLDIGGWEENILVWQFENYPSIHKKLEWIMNRFPKYFREASRIYWKGCRLADELFVRLNEHPSLWSEYKIQKMQEEEDARLEEQMESVNLEE